MKRTIFLLMAFFSTHALAGAEACEQALDAGDPSSAIARAQDALKKTDGQREEYLCLGRAQSELGRHAEAMAALQAAGKLATRPVDRMIALILQGNELRAAQKPDEAIVLYRQSLEIAVTDNNNPFQLLSRNQLGAALQEKGDAAAALEEYQPGLKLAANDNERADSHARIAAAHSLLGQHDKAVEHQLKAMLYEERAGDFNHYANANIELGRICLAARQYADAEKWLGKFLGTIAGAGDSYWQAKARYVLAQVKAAQGVGAEAREQLAQARAMAGRIGADELLAEIVKAESAM